MAQALWRNVDDVGMIRVSQGIYTHRASGFGGWRKGRDNENSSVSGIFADIFHESRGSVRNEKEKGHDEQ